MQLGLPDGSEQLNIFFCSAGPVTTVQSTNTLQSSRLKAARLTIMSESPTTTPSSVPSPALSTLSLTDLKEVSDKDKQEAAQLKADANKAFLGKLSKLVACLLAKLPTVSEKAMTLRGLRNYTPQR